MLYLCNLYNLCLLCVINQQIYIYKNYFIFSLLIFVFIFTFNGVCVEGERIGHVRKVGYFYLIKTYVIRFNLDGY